MYIKYLIYSLCQLFCMLICYLTNPIVVLFADRQGELPKVLRLWQTWDSALDNRQYVLYDCPRWLSYDFDDYYECSAIPIGHGRSQKVVRIKKPFPRSLWLKRYLNRVFWLYRNCGYGFEFYPCLAWTRTRRLSAGMMTTLLLRLMPSATKTMTLFPHIGDGASI